MKITATGLFLAVFVTIRFEGAVYAQSSEVIEVLAVADAAVARGPHKMDMELVSVKKYSTPSKDTIAQQRHAKELANRTYWMVYYIGTGHGFVGDATVFVDATNRQVIAVQRGR